MLELAIYSKARWSLAEVRLVIGTLGFTPHHDSLMPLKMARAASPLSIVPADPH